MKFKAGTSDDTKKEIFVKLDSLRLKDLGILEMVHGSFNANPTGAPGVNRGYTDGLVVTFESVVGRNRYNDDPDHQQILMEDILPNLEGAKEGLLRFDFIEAMAKEVQ